MPGFFHEAIDRKQFLSRATSLGAAMLFNSTARADSDTPAANQERFRVALLSDTHIPVTAGDGHRGFLPQENLAKVVPQVVESQPKLAIVNGDAARLDGQVGDYEKLRELLTPLAQVAPIHIGLGNHDDRGNFFNVFPADAESKTSQPVTGKHVSLVDTPVVRIVVLDSLLYVNKVAGLLGKNQRDWLAEFLPTATDKPIACFVHHTLDDGDGSLLDVDRLFSIVRPHKQVKAIFYGHSHRYEVSERDGVKLINLPAVGYNFTDDQPVGWVDAEFHQSGVAMTLKTVGGNQNNNGKTTDVIWG
ncbi:MAG: metallophosphoesterase [Planctomycetales bacterium]|nr:metallophosphoesterase [Planctomycetales bacterium]